LGGFANISFERNNQRIAYDICPVNVVLNHYSQQLGFAYDSEGLLAAQGKLHTSVLNHLNQLDYYTDMPPKSLGIEWVQKHVLPSISQIENTKDILRTYTEHASSQIAKSIENTQTVLFTGGGVFNSFLMRRVQALSNAKIVIPDKVTIEYKEALIFAFLGWLRSENITNCLASVTGAKKDHSSGKIFTPN
jgi:anhydro-N-acetylmuramic acid kinase